MSSAPQVPLFDLAAEHAPIEAELRAAFERVLRSGRYVLGPELEAFEAEVARYLGVEHAIGVSSGTDAVTCALMAAGVGPGDEVITANFSFVAAAECIARLGAVPRLVDIEPGTFNLDPEAVQAAVTPRTRAVVVVHLYGAPADLERLTAICARHGLALIEDAAQSFGAALRGKKLGAWGAAGCFSFFPSKPLGGFGDGGLVVTGDGVLAERCRRLRVHGASAKYRHEELGGNFRLDELQAALLRVKLVGVDQRSAQRRRHAQHYLEALRGSPGLGLPMLLPGAEVVWSAFTVRWAPDAPDHAGRARDRVVNALADRGIQAAVHYPRPIGEQPAFARLARDPTPESDRAARQVLSLPVCSALNEQQVGYVVRVLGELLNDSSLRP